MSLPLNQYGAFWRQGNPHQKHPRHSRNPNKYPQNTRLRCSDCSAQFHEKTQATQWEWHCSKNSGGGWACSGMLHHSFRYAPRSSEVDPEKERLFRTVSDSTDYWNKVFEEDN